MALVSDAGTPGISDPGFLLVRECLSRGLKVECLPGATAFVPALLKSGFGAERFTFEGFLPVKKGRQTRLRELATETRTMIFYESPHRIVKTLEQLAEVSGPERQASVSRELTKLFEETVNGTLPELAANFAARSSIKGEIVCCRSRKYQEPAREPSAAKTYRRSTTAMGSTARTSLCCPALLAVLSACCCGPAGPCTPPLLALLLLVAGCRICGWSSCSRGAAPAAGRYFATPTCVWCSGMLSLRGG